MADATVIFDGDDDPSTFHLAAMNHEGRIVGIASWLLRPSPDEPQSCALQLRGMATAPTVRGTGIGRNLLDVGIDHARNHDISFVWANARDSALGFYERHGFRVVGEGFIETVTNLPHHRVLLQI